MHKIEHFTSRRIARVLAIGIVIKLAIGAVAYALLTDIHQLATAAL